MYKTKALRSHRQSIIDQNYCVTFVTKNRYPAFFQFNVARLIVNAMKFQDSRHYTKTFAFVVMPDHVHWLFQLKSHSLAKVLHSVKSFTATQVNFDLWQDGYFEHQLRKDEDLVKMSRYIVANPLRAGLVKNIGDYPFWSAIWINGEL